MSETTGGALVARTLHQEGVDHFFGIVDGTYLQLFAQLVELGIPMVSPRHESIALHMAGAYARLTGKLGVCDREQRARRRERAARRRRGERRGQPRAAAHQLATDRHHVPGSRRRLPVLRPLRGDPSDGEMVGVGARPIERIPELLRAALRACWSGRPGVVHLDVPENLINGSGPALALPPPHAYRRVEPLEPSDADVERAAEMLARARLPIIHAGSGVLHAQRLRRSWRASRSCCTRR